MARARTSRRTRARKKARPRGAGLGERLRREAPLLLGALVVLALALRHAHLSPGTYQDDDVDHYFLALDAFRHPVKFLDAWGMPFLTLVIALPARLFGYAGVEATTALATAATAYLAGWTARRLDIGVWPVVPILYGTLPLAFELSFSSLAEPYGALLVAAALAFHYGGHPGRGLVVLGLLPLARIEGALLLGVMALLTWRDTTWRDRFLAALPLVSWALLAALAHGDPLYIIASSERPLNSLGVLHYARNLAILLGAAPVAWFLWGVAGRLARGGRDGPGFPAAALLLFLVQGVALTLLAWDAFPVGRSVGFLRHLLVVFPAFLLVAAWGFDDWLAGGRGRGWIPVGVLVLWTGLTAWRLSHELLAHSIVVPGVRDELRWIVTLVVTGLGAAFVLRPPRERMARILMVAAALAVGFLGFRAVPPIELTGERKVVNEAVRFLRENNLQGARTYTNHPWFAFLSGRDRFDHEHTPLLTRANLATAPPGSIVVWENHYGNRLWGDVEVEMLRADPDLMRLLEAETGGMSRGGKPFTFRVVVFLKR